MSRSQLPPGQQEVTEVADRLHSAAIHLLRGLRPVDAESGLTAARLSALSVVVFGGPIRVGDLARAEQVKPPTISRMLKQLVSDGLVERSLDPGDGRAQLIRATARGRALLMEARARRVQALAKRISQMPDQDFEHLSRLLPLLESLRGDG